MASSSLLPGDGTSAIDSSGWERGYASRHYTKRRKIRIKALKVTLLVDTKAQMVLDLHLTTTRRHDTKIAPLLVWRNRRRFKVLIADKGYDAKSLRLRLRDLGKRPLIKHREFKPWDKLANSRMDSSLYHRRSVVETVLSVLKRKYGDYVRSRVWWRQFREVVLMCLVYNLERALEAGVVFFAHLLTRLLCFFRKRISTEPVGLKNTGAKRVPAPLDDAEATATAEVGGVPHGGPLPRLPHGDLPRILGGDLCQLVGGNPPSHGPLRELRRVALLARMVTARLVDGEVMLGP